MVVSPDPGLVNQVRGAIQVLGGKVATSPTGELALVQAAQGSIELVIAATELPGMDGYDLCRRLKSLDSPPRTVLVHSSGDRRVGRLAGEVGADATLRRPFQGFQLARRLEELMGDRFFVERAGLTSGSTPAEPEFHPAAASLVDPMTGVFYGGQGDDVDVQISADESWAEAVVSAAIHPLEDEDLPSVDGGEAPGPDETQDLPELAVQTFDEEHPVSVPVDAGTTAHFRPIKALGDNQDSDASEHDDSDSDAHAAALDDGSDAGQSESSEGGPASSRPEQTPEPAAASVSMSTPLVEAGAAVSRSAELSPATGGFLPAEEDLPASRAEVQSLVREEIDRLAAPGGQLAATIQRSVATAVATAMRQVLPALASEAARMATKEHGEAE